MSKTAMLNVFALLCLVLTTHVVNASTLSETAVLAGHQASTAKDIVGWNYITRDAEGQCYTYYSANPPLGGTTALVSIPCPLGLSPFDSVKLDAADVIAKMHQMNCGSEFVSLILSWPVTPSVTEPLWRLRTDIGCEIVIGANTGKEYSDSEKNTAKTHDVHYYSVSKTAVLKGHYASTAKDIIGWNHIELIKRGKESQCYTFYSANPPLVGMSTPISIPCPLGLRPFGSVKLDATDVIAKMNQMDCGSNFVSLALNWPVTASVTEPLWHLRTSIGSHVSSCEIVIGANTGKVYQ